MNGQAEGTPYNHRKHFTYVALATLFVATIPLNGFLLQNAVIVESVPASTNATVKVPMLDGDNFSNAQVSARGDESDGGVTDWSVMLRQLSQIVTPKVSAIADLGAYNTTCLGSCKTTVRGMGFQVNCEDSEQPYTISLNSEDSGDTTLNSMIASGTDVLSVAVTYHYLNINRMQSQLQRPNLHARPCHRRIPHLHQRQRQRSHRHRPARHHHHDPRHGPPVQITKSLNHRF